MDYLLDDMVWYNNGIISGKALIKGISPTEMAVIGKGYILKDISGNFPNETYPYSHFSCFECHIKLFEGKK